MGGAHLVGDLLGEVAAAALVDLARGRTLSIPDPRYKALMGAAKLVPRGLLGGISSRTGGKYGPRQGDPTATPPQRDGARSPGENGY